MMRIMINGREARNPAARALVRLILLALLALLLLVLLPLIGIALAVGAGVLAVGVGVMLGIRLFGRSRSSRLGRREEAIEDIPEATVIDSRQRGRELSEGD
jgi:hypothetical protein